MSDAFRFAYDPATLVYGRDSVVDLGSELAALGCDRALVVAGETVGTTSEVVDPVRAGLSDRCADVLATTSSAKRLRTAYDVAARMRADGADALVALGGGSSLDVATVASVLAAGPEREYEAVRETFLDTGTVPVPDGDLPPLLSVPTTLAGADLSVVAGITAEADGETVNGGVFDGRLMPAAVYYDPALVETTPHRVLCASAMNGFDKGLETLYARNATPVTDGTAMRGLRLLRRGLPSLGTGERDEKTLRDSVVGTMLVQYGASRADGTTLSLIHAFGHGLSRGYDLQQGAAHGIVAPHALAFLFDRVDGRRDLLAEALDARRTADPATAVVDVVREVRDALGLPERLRSVGDVAEDDLPAIAAATAADGFMANTPEGFDPTADELTQVLREAW